MSADPGHVFFSAEVGAWSGAGSATVVHAEGESFIPSQDSAYELLEGAIAVWVIHYDGTQAVIEFASPGSVVLLNRDPLFYFRAEAITTCKVRKVPRREFLDEPANRSLLIRQQVDRNQRLCVWMAHQCRPSVEERLMGVLHLLAEDFGRSYESGIVIEIPLTHRLLAATTGSTRATITRTLRRLEDDGRVLTVILRGKRRYCLPAA